VRFTDPAEAASRAPAVESGTKAVAVDVWSSRRPRAGGGVIRGVELAEDAGQDEVTAAENLAADLPAASERAGRSMGMATEVYLRQT